MFSKVENDSQNPVVANRNSGTPRAYAIACHLLAFLSALFLTSINSHAQELLDADIAFAVLADQKDANTLQVEFSIAKGYYLYRHSLAFVSETESVTLGAPIIPDGVKHTDEFFGEVETYRLQLKLDIPFVSTDENIESIQLQIASQGCADIGVCYPKQIRSVSIPLSLVPNADLDLSALTQKTQVIPNSIARSEQDQFADTLSKGKMLAIILSFFGVGLLLAFTPCVFPMIPILSGIIAGQGKELRTAKAFALSSTYVLAMAVTYTILGVLIGLSGENIQALFQNAWVLGTFATVFVLLALSMFGFYELQMPSAIQSRLVKLSNSQESGSLIGTAIMGFLSALIVGPCVTAPLIGALIYIAESGNAVLGGVALFSLSMGMGAPLILIGTSAGKLIPRAGAWMDIIKHVFGVMMLFLAVWLLERVLPISVTMALYGSLLIGASIYLGALETIKDHHSAWYKLWKGLGMIALLYGALLMIGAVSGGKSILQPLKGVLASGTAAIKNEHLPFKPIKGLSGLNAALADANQSHTPVMLDFYADWCISCKEMEAFTFPDTKVKQSLSKFTLLQADVTDHDEHDKALMKSLGLFGPPAILFYSPNKTEIQNSRVVGYKNAEAFNTHLQLVLAEVKKRSP